MINASKNKPSHLKALLKKNWILLKRSPWCSLLEILVPVLFALITLAWRQAFAPELTPQTTYYNNPDWSFSYSGILDAAALSLMKDCNADENGGKVGLAPAGNDLVVQLDTIFGKIL